MKTLLVLLALVLLPLTSHAQEINLFGPRAAVGNLSRSGDSSMKKGVHSAFGWEIELPYTSGDLTGYGEAGFMLLAIEQGKVFPYGWGYFGVRYNTVGLGIGPAINPVGFGLGANMYYQFLLEKVRIPVGLDWNFVKGTTRVQLFVGFNYR